MLAEALAAALLGALAIYLVLRPIFSPPPDRTAPAEPMDPEETPKGVALAALKEIEFDRETGKLSDADYQQLKQKYTAEALAALRVEERRSAPTDVEAMIAGRVQALRSAAVATPAGGPACVGCGPRPEPDARFCSSCGRRLQAGGACARCGAALAPDSRYCEACGTLVAA